MYIYTDEIFESIIVSEHRTMTMAKLFVVFLLCLTWADFINGHGFMKDPISRSAVMNPTYNRGGVACSNGATNWTPQGSFCGGRSVQESNRGLCSACGENYAQSYPRPHDYGGQYATSITPTRIYLEGQEIEVIVSITAAHRGTFKFKLCSKLESDYPGQDILTKCFSEGGDYILLAGENGRSEFPDITAAGTYTYNLRLPAGVTCPKGCSMQWWYEAGNSPGVLVQEHFVNCADIKIVNCAQYTSGSYDMSSCGKGPTAELESCTVNGGAGGNGGGGNAEESDYVNGGYTNGGNVNGGQVNGGYENGGYENGGYDNGGHVNGGYVNCGQVNGGYENGGQVNSGYGNGGNVVSGPIDGGVESCPSAGAGVSASSCTACTNAQCQTCNNKCCYKGTIDIFFSTKTKAPDMWCENHCTMTPPFCPANLCYKKQAISWKDVCSSRKSLKSILERLESGMKTTSEKHV